MNGRGWSTPQVVTLVAVLFTSLLAVLLLHRDTRIHDRFNAIEDRIEDLGRTVTAMPVPVPASVPGSPAAPGAGASVASDGYRSPTAPTPDERKPIPPQGGVYVQGEVGEPETLNYYTTSGGLTNQIVKYTHNRLIELDLDKPPAVKPSLAVAWKVSEDKLRYTYRLRRGVVFSDGSPFTADDVIFTYNVIMDPAVPSDHQRAGLTDVKSVRKIDDFTIEVEFAFPYWKGLYVFAHAIRVLPQKWFEKEIPRFAKENGIETWSTVPGEPGFGDVFKQMREPPPGTGPYMYRQGISWKTQESITLFRNPLSWEKRERPWTYNLDEMQWRIIKDQTAQNEEFRKGRLDVIVVAHDTWEDNLSKDAEINRIANHFVYDHTGLGFYFIAWNCRRPPFDDARVRRAMTMLTDRWTVLREFFRNNGHVATCVSKRTYPEYSLDIEPWPFDIDRARELLAEAGWKDTNGDGILDRNGKDFAFDFKYPSGLPMYRRLAALLRDACTRAGIRMKDNPLEWSVFLEQYLDFEFEAVALYNSFSEPWTDPWESWHSSHDKPRGNNHPGWHNDEADRLMDAMREEFDDDKRNEMFHRFNEIFHREQPYSLLVHAEVSVLLNKRFQDVVIRPTGMQMLDFWVKPEDRIRK